MTLALRERRLMPRIRAQARELSRTAAVLRLLIAMLGALALLLSGKPLEPLTELIGVIYLALAGTLWLLAQWRASWLFSYLGLVLDVAAITGLASVLGSPVL